MREYNLSSWWRCRRIVVNINKLKMAQTDAASVEDCLKRIQAAKGVSGVVVINSDGSTSKSTMDNSSTIQYSTQIQQLTAKAISVVRDIDPTNDLTFMRIRSKKNEIMVSPENGNYVLVLQNPKEAT